MRRSPRVLVKRFCCWGLSVTFSYKSKETILLAMDPHYGNLNSLRTQLSSCIWERRGPPPSRLELDYQGELSPRRAEADIRQTSSLSRSNTLRTHPGTLLDSHSMQHGELRDLSRASGLPLPIEGVFGGEHLECLPCRLPKPYKP